MWLMCTVSLLYQSHKHPRNQGHSGEQEQTRNLIKWLPTVERKKQSFRKQSCKPVKAFNDESELYKTRETCACMGRSDLMLVEGGEASLWVNRLSGHLKDAQVLTTGNQRAPNGLREKHVQRPWGRKRTHRIHRTQRSVIQLEEDETKALKWLWKQ